MLTKPLEECRENSETGNEIKKKRENESLGALTKSLLLEERRSHSKPRISNDRKIRIRILNLCERKGERERRKREGRG